MWFFVNFSYYGAFIWIPTLLVADGFTLVRSFQFTLIITLAQLPGYVAAAWLVEVWGRRVTLAAFLVGSGISAALFGAADSAAVVLASGIALSFCNLGAWGALYAVTPRRSTRRRCGPRAPAGLPASGGSPRSSRRCRSRRCGRPAGTRSSSRCSRSASSWRRRATRLLPERQGGHLAESTDASAYADHDAVAA